MFRFHRPIAYILICLVSFLPSVFGQQLQERIQVELVQVDLVATDSKGELVTDLTAEDFVLKENGKVQTITHFYNSATDENRYPLTMSFLIDTSYSMHETVAGLTRIDIAAKAAELVMTQLREQDQVELIEFHNQPEALVPFTSDLRPVREKFRTINFREANTAMHDAVIFAVDRIKSRSGRKIIVIFSDGMDSASKAVEEDAIEAIRKSDATIVAFYSQFAKLNFPAAGGGLGGDPSNMRRVKILTGEHILRQYAEMTGGQFFSFRKEPEMLKALEDFRAFVQSQYTLAYKPASKQSSRWRKIKVECKRKGVKLRHREGYWAG